MKNPEWSLFSEQITCYMEFNILGDGVKLPGPVFEGDTTTPPSNHDHDEDGENTTSICI